jgi:hypothetical protein
VKKHRTRKLKLRIFVQRKLGPQFEILAGIQKATWVAAGIIYPRYI